MRKGCNHVRQKTAAIQDCHHGNLDPTYSLRVVTPLQATAVFDREGFFVVIGRDLSLFPALDFRCCQQSFALVIILLGGLAQVLHGNRTIVPGGKKSGV